MNAGNMDRLTLGVKYLEHTLDKVKEFEDKLRNSMSDRVNKEDLMRIFDE